MAKPLPSVFTGPAPALPRRLDRGAEHWARLPWRQRAVLLLCLMLTLFWWHTNRVNNVKATLGSLTHVWVATETLTPGSDVTGKFKRTAVPEAIRPEAAVADEPTMSPVLTIVAGTVATAIHFDGVDKAPAVPTGHRAIAIGTSDADLFSPGSRIDLWDLSTDKPTLLAEQLIVVSVKAQRIIVGVPEAAASTVVQRSASNQTRVAPAGSPPSAPSAKTTPESPTPGADTPSAQAILHEGSASPNPTGGSPASHRKTRLSGQVSSVQNPSRPARSVQHEARGRHGMLAQYNHAQRIYKPP